MKEKIIEILSNEELYEIGFAKIEYFKDLESKLKLQKNKKYDTSFQIGNIDDKTFKNENIFKSAIVVLMPYYKNSRIIDKNFAYVAACYHSIDYHIVLKSKLLNVCNFLKTFGYLTRVCVDDNELDERYLAFKAGLGFYGLNHLLINDKYGSFFFIGIILTDAIFEYDKPLQKTCMMCKRCIENCPNNAIKANGDFNGNQCVSYITQSKNISKADEMLIDQCIFGCDICSNVCPHNKHIVNYSREQLVTIDVKNYFHLSNKEFNNLYGNRAFAWRGRNIFERNINIYKQKLEKKGKL